MTISLAIGAPARWTLAVNSPPEYPNSIRISATGSVLPKIQSVRLCAAYQQKWDFRVLPDVPLSSKIWITSCGSAGGFRALPIVAVAVIYIYISSNLKCRVVYFPRQKKVLVLCSKRHATRATRVWCGLYLHRETMRLGLFGCLFFSFFAPAISLDAVGAASSALTCRLQGDDWRRVTLASDLRCTMPQVFHRGKQASIGGE
jgi:hypothetical protein